MPSITYSIGYAPTTVCGTIFGDSKYMLTIKAVDKIIDKKYNLNTKRCK